MLHLQRKRALSPAPRFDSPRPAEPYVTVCAIG